MAGRRHDEHVVPHKIVDHQIPLVWNLKLVEVAGTYRPTVDDVRKPLRHEMRWIPWRCGGEMKRRHSTLRSHRRPIKCEASPERGGSDVALRSRHHLTDTLDKHGIGSVGTDSW